MTTPHGSPAPEHTPEPAQTTQPLPRLSLARSGEGGFSNYRIPGIVQLNNGDILVTYDGRPTGIDAPGPNSILCRRSTDSGRTFAPQEVVIAGHEGEPKHGYSDASLVYDRESGDLFLFCVYSKDAGFFDSIEGTRDDDRRVLSSALAHSRDNGHTWELRSLTALVKPEGIRATFATSGHGIQIREGRYAGRLVQQFAGQRTTGEVCAYSVYSDDHGATWHMGVPVGTSMDENTVVELEDGRLMMNSRTHEKRGGRWVSFSADGGHTWSEPAFTSELTDPSNNASLIRMNPLAQPGSAEAKELLFSHAFSADDRVNGSVHYSPDNGGTWPVVKTFAPGSTSYSDLVALQDGTFGLVYEAEHNEQFYTSFTREWLLS